MAHKTQIRWCQEVKNKHLEYFKNKRVLDIGSLDVNGNNKGLFENCEYVGLDVVKGKNVDVVSVAHEFKTDKKFDVVLSTNSFEHDMYLERTLKKMIELLKPSGLMFFCGSSAHKEHGTERTSPWASGTSQINNKEWGKFYRNIKVEDVFNMLNLDEIFDTYNIEDKELDIRFVGIKRSNK